MKKYRKTGAALLAAALLCTGGAAQAAEFTVKEEGDLSVEKGWTQHIESGLRHRPPAATS